MKDLLFKISICAFTLSLIGCSSFVTRKDNPDKFDLIRTGAIKKANVLKFNTCLIEGSEVRNRIAYNVKTKQPVRTDDGYRINSYGGDFFLLLSTDIFNSGKTQLLKAKDSALIDLSQQISAFDTCLAKYK